jgi:decaprenylphospho-beta-D-ribofuranose 2-oxidase
VIDAGSGRLLTGWGRACPSAAWVAVPDTADDVTDLLGRPGHHLARGLGRSYGDAAQCAGGTVIDCTAMDRIAELDHGEGTVKVQAGCSLDALLRVIVPRGMFVPVTPGTRYVTVGGAIASDVHGKNHHRDGAIAAHVERLEIATPTGRVECGPDKDPDLFWATAGGMGLTGVVTEATLRLIPIETSRMQVDTVKTADLDSCMAVMAESDANHRYSVAWVDSLAKGRHLGRSVITVGDHAKAADLPAKMRDDPLGFSPSQLLSVPVTPPVSLLNPLTVAAFNEAWYLRAPKRRTGQLESISTFFHPLDGVGNWNALYGPRGFTQYQFVVPFGSEDVVRQVLEKLSAARAASFLVVLKRFGAAGKGHLSFPTEGWTLALDVPLGIGGLSVILDDLDETVAQAGGRVYLSKDGRLRPELVAGMYPRLEEWNAVRSRVDPQGVLASDLSRRLAITQPRSHRAAQGATGSRS